MRIIGGQFKGRRFKVPHLSPTRPTTDYAREALFNILQNNWDFEEVKFLDLFAGSGAISLESASRGSTDITTIDTFAPSIEFIRKTATELDIAGYLRPLKMDVFQFISKTTDQFDLIFAGPPYPLPNLDTIPDQIFEHNLLKPEGWLILEHNPDHKFEDHPNFFHFRNYGTTHFSFFR